MGCGGGQVVSLLAFYSNDPSSNPAKVYSFFCNIVFEKNENKQKRGRVWPTLKKYYKWEKCYWYLAKTAPLAFAHKQKYGFI